MQHPVLFIAFRYLSVLEQGHDGKWRFKGFSNKQSLNSILGLSLGVGVLLIVLSIVNGFEREMRERILGVIPHAVVYHHEGVKDWQSQLKQLENITETNPGLVKPEAVAPLARFQALLVNGEALASAQVSGVVPELESGVSIAPTLMQAGRFSDLNGGYHIILGERLAKKLNVQAGDALKLVMPEARMSLLGMLPRYRQFTVVGIIKVGAAMDEHLAYIPLGAADKLLRLNGKVKQFRLKMPNVFSVDWDAWQIVMSLNEASAEKDQQQNWYASDWTQSQGSLYKIISMTKSMLGLLVLLIVLVASFNLASALIMLVNEKRSDIAILLSQGLSPKQILQVFVLQAMLISLAGLIAGLVLASALLSQLGNMVTWLESTLSMDLTSAYPVHYLPSQILFVDIVLISFAVFSLGFIASLYPAWLAAKVNPAEELKYE